VIVFRVKSRFQRQDTEKRQEIFIVRVYWSQSPIERQSVSLGLFDSEIETVLPNGVGQNKEQFNPQIHCLADGKDEMSQSVRILATSERRNTKYLSNSS
jgi:hypothetical protein